MNNAVWVLIVLCCAATSVEYFKVFYALFTLRCKIETSFGVFLQLLYTNAGRKISIACLAPYYVEKGNFFLCV